MYIRLMLGCFSGSTGVDVVFVEFSITFMFVVIPGYVWNCLICILVRLLDVVKGCF